jgi:predicted nucleic acid-binding protein
MLFREQRARETEERVRAAGRVLASRLIRIEAARALIRLSIDRPEERDKVAALQAELAAFWPRVAFLEMTRDICDLAARISPTSRLRSLDAIHLATFRRARELIRELEMLTFDDRLSQEP